MSRRLTNAFKNILGQKQPLERGYPATMGDGSGNVNVSGRTNYVYVRVSERVIQVYNIRIKAQNELACYIGYLPEQPQLLQVISSRQLANIEYDGKISSELKLHAEDHAWFGGDVAYTHIRQFLPWRIAPVPGAIGISVQGTPVYSSGTWLQAGISSSDYLDLGNAIPAETGTHRWLLLSYTEQGQFVITTGAATTGELTYYDIPEPPADYIHVIGAVRIHTETSEFADAKSGSDIADLRFPGRHRHIDLVPTGTMSGHIIQDEGVDLPPENRLNFVGAGIVAEDNAGTSTDVSVTGSLNGHFISEDGTPITDRPTLDFIGVGIDIDVYDDPTNDRTVVSVSGSGSGHTIQDEGVDLTNRTNLNFIGAGISAIDDLVNDATIVYVTGTSVSLTQLHEHVYQEDHTLACDGAKVNFITANEYEPETTQAFLNGIRLRPYGNSYTEDGLYNSITLSVAPVSGDELILEYITA